MTLLVTSRAPLAIRAEQISTVRPLPLPDAGATVTLATAGGSPAVQLFVVRTRSAVPGFTLSESNAAKVVSICRRLDGMPLAIELAAPRARVMTLDQLLQQLDRRLPLLTSGSRDLPSRQQSLRANIAWSVDLLTREQQTLFRRLAVFAESFTLEAAVAVMGDAMAGAAPSPPIPVWSSAAVANGIAQLLDQSLLTRTEQPDGTPRFGMLETIHEYADEQLEASGETREFRHRHLAWSLSLAEEAAPRLFTVDDDVWLQRLQDEDGNLRAALDWALGPGDGPDVELGLRLCGALSDYWFLTARLSEGRAWLIRAITRSADQTPSPGRARSLIGACQIEQTRAAIAPALMYGELGLAAAEALGDRPGVGRALLFLGNLAMMQQRFPEAQAWHEQALVCFQQVGDQSWVALALLNLGLDDYYLGDLDRAAVRAEEGLALARTTGNRWDTLNGLYVLGLVARARGDFAAANALFGERIHLSWQFGSQRDIADSLSGFGAVAVAAGDRERGARFLGAAEALYRRLEISVPPPLWPDWFALTDAARHDVSSADASPCWASSTIEQAVREALGSLPGSAPFLPPAVP
ncbi:MAG: tetratricopeptide repeat protein [Thermomicrobiales bacterium]